MSVQRCEEGKKEDQENISKEVDPWEDNSAVYWKNDNRIGTKYEIINTEQWFSASSVPWPHISSEKNFGPYPCSYQENKVGCLLPGAREPQIPHRGYWSTTPWKSRSSSEQQLHGFLEDLQR